MDFTQQASLWHVSRVHDDVNNYVFMHVLDIFAAIFIGTNEHNYVGGMYKQQRKDIV